MPLFHGKHGIRHVPPGSWGNFPRIILHRRNRRQKTLTHPCRIAEKSPALQKPMHPAPPHLAEGNVFNNAAFPLPPGKTRKEVSSAPSSPAVRHDENLSARTRVEIKKSVRHQKSRADKQRDFHGVSATEKRNWGIVDGHAPEPYTTARGGSTMRISSWRFAVLPRKAACASGNGEDYPRRTTSEISPYQREPAAFCGATKI